MSGACDHVYKVIIIGAGVTGLQCATDLIRGGVDSKEILILEAQDYVGGRVKEDRDFLDGQHVDLGAEFIHGCSTILHDTAVAQDMGIVNLYCWAQGDGGPIDAAVEDGYGLYYYTASDRLLRFDDKDANFVRTNETLDEIMALDEGTCSENESLSDLYTKYDFTQEMISMADAGYSNTLCSNGETLSLKQMIRWNRYWSSAESSFYNMRFKDGFASIVQYLQQGLSIITNTPITHINYETVDSGGICRIQGSDGVCYSSERVVVTASAHVMHQQKITFTPPLPAALLQAYDAIDMHSACKILLCFRERPWPEGLHGIIVADGAVPEFWFRDVSSGTEMRYLATGFATARYAESLLNKGSDSIIIDTAVSLLDKIMKRLEPEHMSAIPTSQQQPLPEVGASLVKGMVYEWSARSHPYIGGGYGAARAGYDTDYATIISRPIGGCIFLAGEAVASGAGATVCAAMRSGRDTAANILKSLGI